MSGANGTIGDYTVNFIINSAVEEESHDGPTNDTLATAQDIEASFLPLHGAVNDTKSGRPERGAVLGTTDRLDVAPVAEVEPNQPVPAPPDLAGSAQNLDGEGWNLNFNANIADSTSIPHVTVLGTGNGTFDYYSFTVANAGDRGIFDIDFGIGGGSLDTELFLYNSFGNLLAQNDDSSTSNGGGGSTSSLDSFIDFTFAAPGTYIIGVGEFNSFNSGGQIAGNQPDPGDTYTLQVSVENHALNIGGTDPVPEVEPNDPGPSFPDLAGTAQNLDGEDFTLTADPNIADSTSIPHVTVLGTGNGSFDYYSFTVANAGDTGIFDIDFGIGGGSLDTELFLYDSFGNLLSQNDDSSTANGGGGSTSSLDSFIQHTFASPGTYIIGVGEFNSFNSGGQIGGNTPDPGDTYTLQVSIQNHPFVESTPDFFSFDLEAGESATLAVTALGSGDELGLELLDSDGNVVATPDVGPSITEDFETGSLGPQWSTSSSNATGRIQVTGAFGTAAGSFALLMDDTTFGGFTRNEAILTVDLTPFDNPILSFSHADIGDEQHSLPGNFIGSANGDGVAISDDGVNWHTILNATNVPFGVWQQETFDLAAEAAGAGMTLGPNFQIKFQQFDNFPLTSDGRGYDEITITDPGPTNVDVLISNFVASTSDTYFARVTGEADTDYSLLVTRNADFSIENNNNFRSAQEVLSAPAAGRQWILGHVGAGEGLTLQAIDSGWWDSNGIHSPTNTNYLVGLVGPAREFRNFFVFDLSSVSGAIVSAELGLDNPFGGYVSVDPSESYSVFDVSTPISTLRAGGSGQTAIFDDLGDGVELGSQVISSGDDGQLVTTSLNADGLAYLSANTGGQVALGGALTSISGTSNQLAFAFSNAGFVRQLTVSTADSDFYKVTLGKGKPLDVETFTPAARSGEFVNVFDPMLNLYDAAGNLVASDDNSRPDGRNARLKYKVPAGAGGTYFIEVLSSDATAEPTSGEYILGIKGNVPSNALQVSSDMIGIGGSGAALTQPVLDQAVATGIDYWRTAGIDAVALTGLSTVRAGISDLSGSLLGLASSYNTFVVDRVAAGYGWTFGTNPQAGGVALNAVVIHELGHVLGFGHDVMGATLETAVQPLISSSFRAGLDTGDPSGSFRSLGTSSRFEGNRSHAEQ